MALLAGDRVSGRYRLLRPLGQGGAAALFLAEDERSSEQRALKELTLQGAEALSAFRSEFALLARVVHPHLTRVRDFGSWRVRGALCHYYTADVIEGTTIGAQRFKDAALAQRVLLEVLDALSALHALGIRHGDVSPENVLLDATGRATLIDLGAARPITWHSDVVAGTAGFIAPELLTHGRADARADLYSLGLVLRDALDRSQLRPKPALNRLLQRMTASAPEQRPSSVLEVLQELGGSARQRSGLPGASASLVGRASQLARFEQFMASLAEATPGPRVACVTGPAGSGVTRLSQELVARAELVQQVVRARGSERSALLWLLRASSSSVELQEEIALREVLQVAAELNTRDEPVLLVMEDAQRLSPRERDKLWALGRSLESTSRAGLLVTGLAAPRDVSSAPIELGALDLAALREWTQRSLSDGTLRQLLERTGGLPRAIEHELARRTPAPRAPAARAIQKSTSDVEAQSLAALPQGELDTFALLLALENAFDLEPLGVTADALPTASSLGLLTRENGYLCARDPAALRSQLSSAVMERAHRRAASAFDSAWGRALGEARRHAEAVRQLALAGAFAECERRLRELESLWRADARTFAQRLEPALFAAASSECLLLLAELALAAGEFHDVLSGVASVLRRRPASELRARCELSACDALLRLGRTARAERIAAKWCRASVDSTIRARALERSARARLQRSDALGAAADAELGLSLAGDEPVTFALREAQSMAWAYLGRSEQAIAGFSSLLRDLGAAATPRDRCRLLGQRAIASFRSGQLGAALADHAQALELAERAGLDDLVCVSSLNLGTVEQQTGDWGGALASYERGLRVAHAIGRESTELTLRYNLANLKAELGDGPGAAAELSALATRASPVQARRFAPAIALVRAELAIAEHDFAQAEAELARARDDYSERALKRELAEVGVCAAKLELARRVPAAARTAAEAALTAATEEGADDLALQARFALARTCALLGEDARAQFEECLQAANELGQRSLEADILTQAALHAAARSDPAVGDLRERAQRAWDRLAARLPDALRETFWRDPRRAVVERRTRLERVTGAGGGARHVALTRLLALSRRINSSLSLERVLDYAVDAAVELSGAERGFLLLSDGEQSAPRVVARHPPTTTAEPPSQSIVERALSSEAAVLTTDAQADQRFAQGGSIHALRLKSVLCVPVSTPSGVLGALYVDSRLQRTRFRESDQELLSALADHVAIAVSNARLHEALEAQRRELEQQKRTVERLAAARERELTRLQQRVDAQQRELGARYDYSRIVGKSAAMRRVFEQLDRITESDVNVLIQGESGTGKELVARAIHFNGPRRAAPFIGVNCAALPENLLESELFGHVRGAFTGADRDRPGLLLEAGEGTLFLDEVGELPFAMQAKLLRAVQEREVRPIGAARSQPFKARLLSATHRDLLQRAAAGSFREDLYYRLAVVVVTLPALRERSEDIPALARAIVQRLAREARREPPEISGEVLRRLSAYSFPGNVRELENLMTRALVFGRGERIELADLDLAQRPPARASSGNRREYEAEERQRLLTALSEHQWNVSHVARLFGIPRNTFYRKLKRYGLSADKP